MSERTTNAVLASEDVPWDFIIRPDQHWFDFQLRELWTYRDLLFMFVRRDIVSVYKQTILGPIWFFIQPLLTTIVFTIVFGKIAGIPTDGVPPVLFYLSGITLWNYFAESFDKTSSTFISNQAIFGKVYFPRLIVPLSIVISNLLKFFIQLALFVLVLIWYAATSGGDGPTWWVFATPALVALMAGLGLGFGIIFTSLTTKYRDLTFLISFGVQLAMYATPIIYPMNVLSPEMRNYLWFNPIAHVVETFRHAFLGSGDVSITGLVYSAAFTTVTLFFGILIFNRTEQTFMDTV